MTGIKSLPIAKLSDVPQTRSPSNGVAATTSPEKASAELPQSPKPGSDDDRRPRHSKTSITTQRSQQITQTAAQRIAAIPRPLSRERSARRGGSWESQLRSPWISLASQDMRDEKASSTEVPPTGKFLRSNSLPILQLTLASGLTSNANGRSGSPPREAPQPLATQPSSARRSIGRGRNSQSPTQSANRTKQVGRCGTSVAAPVAICDPKNISRSGKDDSPRQDQIQPRRISMTLTQERIAALSLTQEKIAALAAQVCQASNDSPRAAIEFRQQFNILPDSPRLEAQRQPKFKQEKPFGVIRQSSLNAKLGGSGNGEKQAKIVIRQSSAGVEVGDRQDKALQAAVQALCTKEQLSQEVIVSTSIESPRLAFERNIGQHIRDTSPHAANTTPRSRSPKFEDPYRLRRFTMAQKATHADAVAQIRAGRKTSGWMWFEIPTPPHIVKGVERGSSDNRRYALRSDEEVLAFLQFQADGVDLRKNFLELMTAVRDQLRSGRHPTSLMGKLSAPKLVSSVRLFERVTRGGTDKELYTVLEELVELLECPV